MRTLRSLSLASVVVFVLGFTVCAQETTQPRVGSQTPGTERDQEQQAQGKIKTIDVQARRVVITVQDRDMPVQLDARTKVIRNGKEAQPRDLRENEEVAVRFVRNGQNNIAREITSPPRTQRQD